jgi:hypothetical protein
MARHDGMGGPRVLEVPRAHMYPAHLYPAGPPQHLRAAHPRAAWPRPSLAAAGGRTQPAAGAPAAASPKAVAGEVVCQSLMRMQWGLADRASQVVHQVGPRPLRGEVALRACVGLVPEAEIGAYGSPDRRQAESDLLGALATWAAAEGAARPSAEAGSGWTLECKWAGGRGTRRAAMDIRPVGGPSSAAQQQLHTWLRDASIRLPNPYDHASDIVVPCLACPGDLPLGQVQVTLVGLPTSFMLKDTHTAVLRAVGYTGLPGAGAKLRVTEVFRGFHPDEPTLADGSLCAFVDQPMDDPTLARLPSSVNLGQDQTVLEVRVSSRPSIIIHAVPGPRQPPAGAVPPPPRPPPRREAPTPPAQRGATERPACPAAAPAAGGAPGPAAVRAEAGSGASATAGEEDARSEAMD